VISTTLTDSLFSSVSTPGGELPPEFDQLIQQDKEESYLDPSHHDLTQDHRGAQDPWYRSKRRQLFCFHCNRAESHAPALRHQWQYSFLIGMTLGLIKFLGPYFCRCCGHRRFIGSDRLNPKYWLYQRRLRRGKRRNRTRR
jgi:hypothetical protein